MVEVVRGGVKVSAVVAVVAVVAEQVSAHQLQVMAGVLEALLFWRVVLEPHLQLILGVTETVSQTELLLI
jgi:hypothetical protein